MFGAHMYVNICAWLHVQWPGVGVETHSFMSHIIRCECLLESNALALYEAIGSVS